MEKEIYYAIHEAIQVMEHYNNGEDFALVSSLRRMHELEQKLQQHGVMQAEVSDGYLGHAHGHQPTNTVDTSNHPKQSAEGAAVGSSAVGKGVRYGGLKNMPGHTEITG